MFDFLIRGVKLIGSTLRSRSSDVKAHILQELERELWTSFTTGKIKVLIHKTLPITESRSCHP